jgi:hypothetical protein
MKKKMTKKKTLNVVDEYNSAKKLIEKFSGIRKNMGE